MPGPNALATLRLNFPLGQQRRARAAAAARRRASTEPHPQPGPGPEYQLGILVALNELEQTIEELKKAHEAAGYYREAVENEREKLRIGTSTVIDVITTADRLSNALVNEISAQSRATRLLWRASGLKRACWCRRPRTGASRSAWRISLPFRRWI